MRHAVFWRASSSAGCRPLDKKGARSPKKIFPALWASVWSKNKGGLRPPLDPPLIRASINVLTYITKMRDTPTRVHFLHAFSNIVAD